MGPSFFAIAVAAACGGDATAPPTPIKLVGHWAETPALESASRQLVLSRGGSFQWIVQYSATEYWRTEGTFEVERSRLTFHPARLVSGSGSGPEVVTSPYPWGGVFDDCEYELVGGQLVLHYTTYPADAPVPTTMRLVRID